MQKRAAFRWNEETILARLAEHWRTWLGDDGGRSSTRTWSRAYIDGADPSFVRSVERLGFHLDDLVRSIGGSMHYYWVATNRIPNRRGAQRRSVLEVAVQLRQLHYQWSHDAQFGKLAGKRLGCAYLTRRGEQGLYVWMIRHKNLQKCIRHAGQAVAADWCHTPGRPSVAAVWRSAI